MVVSSSARSLVLLFYYNKWGCVIFYNPWKVLAACKTLFLFFFSCSPFHIFILLLLWRLFFVFPSTSGMYFANLCVTVPTHLVINWALGKANSIPRDRIWLVQWEVIQFETDTDAVPNIYGERESKYSNTIGGSTPVHIGLSLIHTLPFFCQTKCSTLACK